VEAELTGYLITQSICVEFVVTVVIISASWRDCMSRNQPLSITARADKDITRYEHREDGTA